VSPWVAQQCLKERVQFVRQGDSFAAELRVQPAAGTVVERHPDGFLEPVAQRAVRRPPLPLFPGHGVRRVFPEEDQGIQGLDQENDLCPGWATLWLYRGDRRPTGTANVLIDFDPLRFLRMMPPSMVGSGINAAKQKMTLRMPKKSTRGLR
jgi:hypothetical protein